MDEVLADAAEIDAVENNDPPSDTHPDETLGSGDENEARYPDRHWGSSSEEEQDRGQNRMLDDLIHEFPDNWD